MTECILTPKRPLIDYTAVIGEDGIQELRMLAKPLSGARVLHINATANGGGVAEVLKGLVPLMCELGLDAEWRVLQGADEFYKVTKTMHNGLQGMQVPLTPDMKNTWVEYNSLNADLLSTNGDYDFVVAHDPQAAGLLKILRDSNSHQNMGPWIWRCHIDLTEPQPSFWEFLKPYVEVHDAAIFSKKQYFPKDLHGPRCFDVPPGIDPLTVKNSLLLDDGEVHSILMRYGIDPDRPFIFKVSRFDPWKDFCGIIDIYDVVRQEFPEVQLVLVGGGAGDDPEAWACYQETCSHTHGKGDIHILWGQNGVGSPEINAFQQAASVVVQKSIREGFGLIVAEALWKRCPVVASDVGGITLQISHGETGYLARSVNEWVEAITYLLQNRQIAIRIGNAGRNLVQQHFLITRCLRDYLKIFQTFSN